jgi:hypothetical protein
MIEKTCVEQSKQLPVKLTVNVASHVELLVKLPARL